MKIYKSASDKKIIRMSKSEWTNIGKKMGWIKNASELSLQPDLNKIYESISNVFLGEKIPFDISDLQGNIIIPAKKQINKSMLINLCNDYPNVNIPEPPIKTMIDKKFNQSKQK